MKGGEVQMLDQDWLCYKYCKSRCSNGKYEEYSRCRLVNDRGDILDDKTTYYGCKC